MKQFKYMVKIVLDKDCKDVEKLNAYLKELFSRTKMNDLGNGFYGTDNHEKGLAVASTLRGYTEVRENTTELLWYNGRNFDSETGYEYVIEDLKESWEEFQKMEKRAEERRKKWQLTNKRKANLT